jgi:hypothetical protein
VKHYPGKKFPGLLKTNCCVLVFPLRQTTEPPATHNQKKAFGAKLSIALEEIDESTFWLEMIKEYHLFSR